MLDRIIYRRDLKKLIEAIRRENKTIVCVNGCFDMLHVGHIRYLTDAKTLGDILIVALNSDASVRALKGSERPILDEVERAKLLLGLKMVDYVTIFDELDAIEVLKIISPDVHAKGTDYTVESVPEAQATKGYVKKVAIVGDPKDHSTKDIIKEIKKRFA